MLSIPTMINFMCFWLYQLPFAYITAVTFDLGPIWVFKGITLAEVLMAVIVIVWFKKDNWKSFKVRFLI